MAIFEIKCKETHICYFGVEAADEDEAMERFNKWYAYTDTVYDAMNNTYHVYNDTYIEYEYDNFDDCGLGEEYILTDEMYQHI